MGNHLIWFAAARELWGWDGGWRRAAWRGGGGYL